MLQRDELTLCALNTAHYHPYGGGWERSDDRFVWNVHSGVNRLEARTVNAFGVIGPVSTAELSVKE